MEQIERNTSVNEFLEKQFDRVNTWLSFAEAKNGVLIAFNIAVVTAIVDLLNEVTVISAVCIISLILSTSIALISFFPDTKTTTKDVPALADAETDSLNLIFYGDISKLNYEQYRELVCKRYLSISSLDNYQDDLCKEIHYNSKIAMRKYCFFKCALKLEVVSGFIIIFLVIVA